MDADACNRRSMTPESRRRRLQERASSAEPEADPELFKEFDKWLQQRGGR
jgi:hypothetical protein